MVLFNKEIKIVPIPNKIKTVDFGEIDIFFNDKVGILLTIKWQLNCKIWSKIFKLKLNLNLKVQKLKALILVFPPAGEGTPSK